jgi:hypothetical protein
MQESMAATARAEKAAAAAAAQASVAEAAAAACQRDAEQRLDRYKALLLKKDTELAACQVGCEGLCARFQIGAPIRK